MKTKLLPLLTPAEMLREEFLDPMAITPYRLAKDIGGSTLGGGIKVVRGIVKW